MRAVYESIASFCDFADTLAPLLEAADFDKIAELVSARAFATRIPSFLKRGADMAVTPLPARWRGPTSPLQGEVKAPRVRPCNASGR